MFISLSKARRVGESSCPMFADYYGHAADPPPMQSISGDNNDGTAYTSYVSIHGRHARFAMPAMFGASAAKGR